MKSPFDSFDSLDAFLDSVAVVDGRTVKACVYPLSRPDPLSDDAEDTESLVTTIVIRSVGSMAWNDERNPPKVGDAVTVGDRGFVVLSVSPFPGGGISMKVKTK